MDPVGSFWICKKTPSIFLRSFTKFSTLYGSIFLSHLQLFLDLSLRTQTLGNFLSLSYEQCRKKNDFKSCLYPRFREEGCILLNLSSVHPLVQNNRSLDENKVSKTSVSWLSLTCLSLHFFSAIS